MLDRVSFFDSKKARKIHIFFIVILIASIFVGFNYRVPLVYGALLGLYLIFFKLDDNLLVVFSKDLVWFLSLLLWFIYYLFHGLLYGDDVSVIGRETIPLFIFLFYVSLFYFSKIKIDLFLVCVSVSLVLGGIRTFYNAYYLDLSRPSFTYQPIIDAHIHLLGSMICLFYFNVFQSRPLNYLLLFAFIIGLVSAILTETRGIYPALVFLMITYIYKRNFFKGKNIIYVFLGGLEFYFWYFLGRLVIGLFLKLRMR
ncbi:hypothetical protein LH51_07675 [Nitrincola sp. A-D6]|uniref:hypothetical protein n=1 Tax=Nitrincola sp. A-D6 TaxID=1545442 RepID=UPI00051FCA2B|nr:hypothetical protein [Nitrincola sp. A-D6]KGK42390.1 hypothetical protein LH51_07675 [Nitrincola sp. A-D6]